MRLKNKTILITGAGSGIGKAASILFAKEGGHIIINDLLSESGNETLNEIKEFGGRASFIKADVTKAVEVERMVSDALSIDGKIDILFNNAGISCVGALHETSEESWDKVTNVNIKGVFLPSKFVLPHMMKRKDGVIINMSSCIAEIGLSQRAAYSATKGAILALSKSMQVDYAPYNIRVNAILPGTILTPFVENYLKNSYENAEDALNNIKKRQLSGDLGRPEDVAKAALFLASDESKFMMGSPLYIDGGVTFGKMA
ncbi:glucose 1-dehydrogenase [Bacillus sp. FJAT-29790]|uniref:SDR family NAD(P)-dependent oxidoreductase n=1 Tax=Bacillus sp. FJAT-29790 TaxID=1895002 RepID=UPI001C2445FF|nr:glucose 1-dehydrogenase [Bacillus sp. FJAT-29790]MBU8877575.1 glucose 1-dehydrogenase [Bacillus sp. FJAT-29790]